LYQYNQNLLFNKNISGSDDVFSRYTIRIPQPQSKNIKIDIQDARIFKLDSHDWLGLFNPKISISDEFVDITYDFIVLDETVIEKYQNIRIEPNKPYGLGLKFSLEYAPIRMDWILQAFLGAIFLTLAFYGGIRWGEKILKQKYQKK
jgi:hypothetical protein